jgi:ABC-type multidrug transport system ATPase subunit
MLSVAETLTMAAQLQMPPALPEASKQSYVDNLIAVLGLAKVGWECRRTVITLVTYVLAAQL